MEAARVQNEPEGHRYTIPVDNENKATEFRFFSKAPHVIAFHLSWVSFMACFISTFAMPPLIPIIRDNLNLTSTDVGIAGIASVFGAIFARLVMGTVCDIFGPRLASSSIILVTSTIVYFTSTASSSVSFILYRLFTGFSLSTFVSTQFWMSSMFSAPVVGRANGFSAGWGNLGGGATQLVMPLICTLIQSIGATRFTAWRIALFFPGMFQTLTAIAILVFGKDFPEGNIRRLQLSGERPKDKLSRVLYHGFKNPRGWILTLSYAFSFGVELTIDNIIAQYFYDRFNKKLQIAGTIAASFGLANIISRPAGGMISDKMGRRYGMRGRLWSLWVVQTISGLLCVLLGRVSTWEASVGVMIVFSLFVQAACGLTFGVVPFVSRRSLGLISGMVGAGGNLGAVITQLIFFKGSRYSIEQGISLMGVMMLCCSLPISLIHFPQWGGMLWGPSNNNATEETYYTSEWDTEEQQNGLHIASMGFAESSRSERGQGNR